MSLAELEPVVRTLPRAEKLQLVRLLVNELVREDDEVARFMGENREFPVWTPLEAVDAAQSLMQALEAGQSVA